MSKKGKLSVFLAPFRRQQQNGDVSDVDEMKEREKAAGGSESDIFLESADSDSSEVEVCFEQKANQRSLTAPVRKRVLSDGGDSPVNQPKRRVKRVISDSDEEAGDGPNRSMFASDEIGGMAFDEKCESAIAELRSLFPDVDVCDLQDELVRCKWSVFEASKALGNRSCSSGDVQIVENGHSNGLVNYKKFQRKNANDSDSDDVVTLKYVKTTSKYEVIVSSDSEEEAPQPSQSLVKAISQENRKKVEERKNKKTVSLDEIMETIESSENDSDEEYDKEDILGDCFVESDDDEGEENRIKVPGKVKETKKLGNRICDLRKKVVEFLQSANAADMTSIPGVSQKKVDVIMELRPFADWNQLRDKIDNHRSISSEILRNCVEVIKAREVVERLMTLCGDISSDIGLRVDKLEQLEQPSVLNDQMKLAGYQLVGLNWLVLMFKKKLNCILADEMGLGKTIQVIALFAHLREKFDIRGTHLIVVPASTLDNWMREINLWCPAITVLLYYGSQEERAELREQIFKDECYFDVIVTTYSMLYGADDRKLFKRIKFEYVVFDEAHMLKNMKSNRYSGLIKIRAKRRLLLTGTPLQNNLLELMSLLIFTLPDFFHGKTEQVKALFTYSNKEIRDKTTFEREKIDQAKKIMKPFVLRRLKTEVLKELPKKIDIIRHCAMTSEQELKYMELVENYTREIRYNKKNIFEDTEFDEKYGTFKRGASMLTELRKGANHPLLLRTHYQDNKLRTMAKLMLKEPTHHDANPILIVEDMQVMHDFELHCLCKQYKSLSTHKLNDNLILESGKFKELDVLLQQCKSEKKRVLLFSQFVIMLDIIEEYMKIRRFKYARLDGSTKVSDRMDLIDKFNNNSSVFVFLLSTRAGGLGINLTSASVVIIHDIDFNPYNDKQAEDRCHRVGQTEEVTVYRLISKNTVEEGMLKIAEDKLRLGRDVSSNKAADAEVESGDVKTLLRLTLGL